MGKGDLKTRRGKLFRGSYGVLRPKKKKRAFSVVSATRKPAEKAEPKSKDKTTVSGSSKSEEPVLAKETVVEAVEAPEPKAKSGKETGEAKAQEEVKAPEEAKAQEEVKEPEKVKEPEEVKEPEKAKAPEEAKEPEEAKAQKEVKEPEKAKAPKEAKEPEEAKAPEEVKEPEKAKAPKEVKAEKETTVKSKKAEDKKEK